MVSYPHMAYADARHRPRDHWQSISTRLLHRPDEYPRINPAGKEAWTPAPWWRKARSSCSRSKSASRSARQRASCGIIGLAV